MGGEGAMMQANQSLKSNRKLVGKRKANRFSFVHTSNEKTEYNLPGASAELLEQIRIKTKQESKLRLQKRIITSLILFLIVTAIIIYFVV